VHVRVFNQHLIILNNYEDATRLMHEAKYSDRPQTVMLHDLYVAITILTMYLILFDNRMGFNWGVSPMPYGPEWRLCRKLLHDQFNRHEIAHYDIQQEGSTRVMLRDLLSTPGDFCTHVEQWVFRRRIPSQNSDI
jgi:cytochrome P450